MPGGKLLNSALDCVDEALEGLTMLHPGLRLLHGHRVVLRQAGPAPATVALLSGGGSGHEATSANIDGLAKRDIRMVTVRRTASLDVMPVSSLFLPVTWGRVC